MTIVEDAVGPVSVPASVRERPPLRLSRLPWVPLSIVLAFVLMGVLAPLLPLDDPLAARLDGRLMSPGGDHWLGTDRLGRDVLARLIWGARSSMIVVALALGSGLLAGLLMGLVSGFFGGIIDAVISRLIDASLALPSILFGLLFAVTMGAGIRSVVLAISLVLWAKFARMIRSEVIEVRERDFVAQARIVGCSRLRILAVHVLPNILNTSMVLLSIYLGQVVLLESILSFLGAGIAPPTPSWGDMIADGQAYLTTAWWLAVVPGIAIFALVLAFNLLGDWVRDFLDPRLRDQL